MQVNVFRGSLKYNTPANCILIVDFKYLVIIRPYPVYI